MEPSERLVHGGRFNGAHDMKTRLLKQSDIAEGGSLSQVLCTGCTPRWLLSATGNDALYGLLSMPRGRLAARDGEAMHYR